ncbi:MAG: ferritin-like domain-containing protein [Cyanobacteria bacterium P01_A01_bin.37]
MMSKHTIAGLDLPNIDESSKLYRILASAMHKHLERSPVAPSCPLITRHPHQPPSRPSNRLPFKAPTPSTRTHPGSHQSQDSLVLQHNDTTHVNPSESSLLTMPSCDAYWDASHFGLDRVTLFTNATPEEQRNILALTSLDVLQESYCIEKAGMGYMSRMVLLSESVQERMIYTLFAADETSHFVQLHPYLPVEPTVTDNSFLNLLSEVVEGDDKTVLLFVIQVVLEGWGLSHYRSLAKTCTYEALSHTLQGFLQDESRHHGTGVTLFNQASMSPASHIAIVDILEQFLRMVQVGPQGIIEAIARVKGHLSRTQKIQILTELDTEQHSGTRLQVLRSLMRGDGAGAIVQDLEERGSFAPLPAHHCV